MTWDACLRILDRAAPFYHDGHDEVRMDRGPYLITGTAGFIGFHLAHRLLGQGHGVVGVDNLNDYYDVRLKQARHAILAKSPHFTEQRVDIADLPALSKVFDAHRPQVVCNLAAQAGVRYSLTHPHVYMASNMAGFLNILELCRAHEISRLVYASSSSVYGGNTTLPFSERDRVDTPISLYAASKRSNELMAHTYGHLFKLQTIGLRFFTVYGPWGRPDMAMWLFAKAIMAGEPIKVFNHGDMQRDFTYIDDIVSGLVTCLQREELPHYAVLNLGNNRCEPLTKMISLIEQACGRQAQKVLLPMQPGDVKATYADIEQASTLLGFAPTTSIDEGIPRFVEWFTSHENPVG